MNKRPWRSEADLADLLIARGKAGREVRLTPDTATFIGLKMKTAALKPTRTDIAALLCVDRCRVQCYRCIGKANEIVEVYGFRAGR